MSGDKMTTGTCVEDLGDINVCVEHSFPVSSESIQENDGPSEAPIEETNGSASETTNDGKKISVISVEVVVIICVAC